MGARWQWFALCPEGHRYGNFSGGADPCYTCGKEPVDVIDCMHDYEGEKCDCMAQLTPPDSSECDLSPIHSRQEVEDFWWSEAGVKNFLTQHPILTDGGPDIHLEPVWFNDGDTGYRVGVPLWYRNQKQGRSVLRLALAVHEAPHTQVQTTDHGFVFVFYQSWCSPD